MTRKFWIAVHLYGAAFFGPLLSMMAISGGLYLWGIKGQVEKTPIATESSQRLNLDAKNLEAEVRSLLANAGIEHEFQYVKRKENQLFTRPTSRDHYQFVVGDAGVTATFNEPDLQKRLVELHLGHGPVWFKHLQKVMAAGILLVVLSGAWLGLSSPVLRTRTWLVTLAGAAASLGLAL